jgi:hypothetical protein
MYRKSPDDQAMYCDRCGHIQIVKTKRQKIEEYREMIRYWYENNIIPDILICMDKSNAYDLLNDIDQYHPKFKETNYSGTFTEILCEDYEACYRESKSE